MKVIVIPRLRNTSHALMREGLESFTKHGGGESGMETLWTSADAKTVIGVYEVVDIAGFHKNAGSVRAVLRAGRDPSGYRCHRWRRQHQGSPRHAVLIGVHAVSIWTLPATGDDVA